MNWISREQSRLWLGGMDPILNLGISQIFLLPPLQMTGWKVFITKLRSSPLYSRIWMCLYSHVSKLRSLFLHQSVSQAFILQRNLPASIHLPRRSEHLPWNHSALKAMVALATFLALHWVADKLFLLGIHNFQCICLSLWEGMNPIFSPEILQLPLLTFI